MIRLLVLMVVVVVVTCGCQPAYSQESHWEDPNLERHLRQLASSDDMDQLSSAAELAGLGPEPLLPGNVSNSCSTIPIACCSWNV
ncbi:MAG UNVERIFIED_CONTAM: hypothetical protein LVR18_44685 [Planctomycetaceae bacterium]|jgi:hypothetical protein